MNREEVFERIAKKVGRKPVSCNCDICRSMCLRVPCLGTPQDILALIDSGYKDKVCYIEWAAGMSYGHTRVPIPMVQIKADKDGRCVFFHDGNCELHDKGLKPTEGRLASHDFHEREIQKEYNLTYQVAREWFQEENFAVVKEIANKLCDYMDNSNKNVKIMSKEEIFEKVKEILVSQLYCEPEDVKKEANLQSDLRLDSLDKIDVVIECERDFDITIEDNESSEIHTVENLCELIDRKINPKI